MPWPSAGPAPLRGVYCHGVQSTRHRKQYTYNDTQHHTLQQPTRARGQIGGLVIAPLPPRTDEEQAQADRFYRDCESGQVTFTPPPSSAPDPEPAPLQPSPDLPGFDAAWAWRAKQLHSMAQAFGADCARTFGLLLDGRPSARRWAAMEPELQALAARLTEISETGLVGPLIEAAARSQGCSGGP